MAENLNEDSNSTGNNSDVEFNIQPYSYEPKKCSSQDNELLDNSSSDSSSHEDAVEPEDRHHW